MCERRKYNLADSVFFRNWQDFFFNITLQHTVLRLIHYNSVKKFFISKVHRFGNLFGCPLTYTHI